MLKALVQSGGDFTRRVSLGLYDEIEDEEPRHVGNIFVHVGYDKVQIEVARVDEAATGPVEVTVR